MRDILEVIERLDAAVEAAVEPGLKFGQWRRRQEAEDECWSEYWSIMEPLTEAERKLIDPHLLTEAEGRAEREQERQAFYAQQTENIRAAWAALEAAE